MFRIQFRRTMNSRETIRFATHGWAADENIMWYVVPLTVGSGEKQIKWEVQVARQDLTRLIYHIIVTNLTTTSVEVEGRYVRVNGDN